MKWLSLILAYLLLVACVPLGAAVTETTQDLPAESQVVVQTVVEEINLDELAGGEVEIIGGDEQSLRKFIQRYFSPIYPGTAEGERKIQIGSLPDDLPIDLPLPDGAQVVASVQEPSAFTQVILDASQTPGEVEDFYAQSMVDLGWRPAPEHQPGGGFVSSWDQGLRFCLDERDAYLEVRALEMTDELTDVRLTLQAPVEYFPCQEQDAGNMDAGSQIIPALVAPQAVQITSSGAGSSSDGSAYNSADLHTSLSIDELHSYYSPQLEQAGWEMVDQGTSEVVAWSAWKLLDDQGEEWGGNLIVMENRLGSNRRIAIVSVEKVQ
jgi:hypothetical protein